MAVRSSSMRARVSSRSAREGQRARLELGAGFHETLDLGGQGDGAFDQGGVIGAGLGGAMT